MQPRFSLELPEGAASADEEDDRVLPWIPADLVADDLHVQSALPGETLIHAGELGDRVQSLAL